MTAAEIKQKAIELGASTCGIGDLTYFKDEHPQRSPFSILPNGKCIIGFGIKVPKGLYTTMQSQTQYYNYTNLGVKYIDETFAEIFLLKMGALIENEGYDACLQRSIPGFKIKGDKSTNPEVQKVFELQFASAVSPEKPAPDVIIDYNKAAVACGLGSIGLHNKVIAPKYGTFMRYVFIITDMPLECDPPFTRQLCDGCGACINACPGHAVSKDGVDSWQCSVYYRGAHKSNPFMTDDYFADHPEREAILEGNKRFDSESAKAIYDQLHFLPNTHLGYTPCLCGKACEMACYKHLKEEGIL